jgi:indolepyruvate ferredoxin oxidoreductase
VADDLETLVSRRAEFLTAYQDAAYGERYRAKVAMIADAERRLAPGRSGLTEVAAKSLFKLMAIKDEFEVARLYTDGSFDKQLAETFGSWDRLEFHLAPPLIARRDDKGHLKKQRFGPWMMRAFKALAAMKALRGSWLDPFSRTAERQWERQLLADYEDMLGTITGHISASNHAAAVQLAAYPQKIRGFGHVRRAQAGPALAERDRLLEAFSGSEPAQLAEAAE